MCEHQTQVCRRCRRVQAELYTVAKHFLWSFRQLDLLCAGEAETKLRGPAQVEEEA